MSTIKTVQLAEQERQALCGLVEALYGVMHVRGLQVVAEREEADMYREGETRIEKSHEELCLEIESISCANALGKKGSPMEQLDRIAGRLRFFEEQEDIGAPRLGKYAKLVRLCLDGKRDHTYLFTVEAEKAIIAAVSELKEEEMPF